MKNKKLIEAGKLKNLNDLVVGASILTSDNRIGSVISVSKEHTNHQGEIVEAEISIEYPNGASFHTYRRDGRSHYGAESDIVTCCKPEDSKVKSVRVYTSEPPTKKMLDFGVDVANQYKMRIDCGETKTKTRVIENDGIMAQGKLTASGMISVKVWGVENEK